MIKKLAEIANTLDEKGMHKEADAIDQIISAITKAASNPAVPSKSQYEGELIAFENKMFPENVKDGDPGTERRPEVQQMLSVLSPVWLVAYDASPVVAAITNSMQTEAVKTKAHYIKTLGLMADEVVSLLA